MNDQIMPPIPVNPLEDQEVMFSPDHQKKMYVIEDAMRIVGAIPKPESDNPRYYDDLLMQLINAVPLN